ncbi:MAG: hypothetical protein KatS3mg108_3344 [Isosphaeraceae bacterium]|jgi:hypothetical protein|nr:MAG: hypothetical protein KatS3mg108_3344 [Isosphaeraceae bacterium]
MFPELPGRSVSRRTWLTSALGSLGFAGCAPPRSLPSQTVRLATNWPLEQLAGLPGWLLRGACVVHGYQHLPQPEPRSDWIILGGPPAPDSERFTYQVGLWIDPLRDTPAATWPSMAEVAAPDQLALDDPTVARGPALALAEFLGQGWSSQNYLTVLRAFAYARRPVAGLLAGPGRLLRGEVAATLGVRPDWLDPDERFLPLQSGLRGAEAVRIERDSPAARALRLNLRFNPTATPESSDPSLAAPQALRVRRLAGLIRAACVEPHAELRAAFVALDHAQTHRPRAAQRAQSWLAQPPPWPPASVTALRLRRDGDRLVDDLISHLVPTAVERRALAQEWLREPRPLDAALLDAIHWTDRPFFAAWLRAEWTAWCRQRYRRARRLALGQGDLS